MTPRGEMMQVYLAQLNDDTRYISAMSMIEAIALWREYHGDDLREPEPGMITNVSDEEIIQKWQGKAPDEK